MLGRYCIQIDDNTYYNSITHQKLTTDQLRESFMLAGQENEAINNYLMHTVEPAYATLIPSWECNVRCPHCYVGHMLEKPSGSTTGVTDPMKALVFLHRCNEHPGWAIHRIAIVGGEPLLHPDFCRTVLNNTKIDCTMTTNGMWNFEEMKDILTHPRLTIITFSLDGVPEHHNQIRRALNHDPNAFATAYRNLARTTKACPDKIIVAQGSTVGRIYKEEERRRFYALMLLAGVKHKDIKLGIEAPSPDTKVTPQFQEMVRTGTRFKPCCDYQVGKQLVIHGDIVYPTYYAVDDVAPLGYLDDAPDTILQNYREYIRWNMPMLNDVTCMMECKAVGICWGLCSNAEGAYTRMKPSSACDRAAKEKALPKVARHGLQVIRYGAK